MILLYVSLRIKLDPLHFNRKMKDKSLDIFEKASGILINHRFQFNRD